MSFHCLGLCVVQLCVYNEVRSVPACVSAVHGVHACYCVISLFFHQFTICSCASIVSPSIVRLSVPAPCWHLPCTSPLPPCHTWSYLAPPPLSPLPHLTSPLELVHPLPHLTPSPSPPISLPYHTLLHFAALLVSPLHILRTAPPSPCRRKMASLLCWCIGMAIWWATCSR